MTVAALKELCKAKGLAVGGAKAALIERLNNADTSTNDEDGEERPKRVASKEPKRSAAEDKKVAKKKALLKELESKLVDEKNEDGVIKPKKSGKDVERLAEQQQIVRPIESAKPKLKKMSKVAAAQPVNEELPVIETTKDKFGNMVHEPTGFVFVDSIVVGYKDGDEVRPLTTKMMETCKQLKVEFEVGDSFDDAE
jgi:hypothetical protein